MLGVVEMTVTTNRAKETINLAGFSKGVYFIQLRYNGSYSGIQKLIIQ
jgi:hypothetical protein